MTRELPVGIIEVVRSYPNFRRLYSSRVFSLLGDWFNLLALIAMFREVSQSAPIIIGGMFILKLMPTAIWGPVAGVIADRFKRTTVMIVTDILRVLVVLSFLVVPYLGSAAVPVALVLIFLQASIAAFFEPARIALLPNLVDKHALTAANTLGAATWSICYAMGTALGGVCAHYFGWRVVMVLDAMSFLLSAWFIVRINYQPRAKRGQKKSAGFLGFGEMIQGFKYLKRRPRMLYLLFFKTGMAFNAPISMLLTLIGERIYTFGNRPSLAVSIFLACRAIGTGLGPIIGRRISDESLPSLQRTMIGGFMFSGVAYLAMSWIQNPYAAMLFVTLGTVGSSTIWVFSTVSLQRLVDDEFGGRVFSAELGMATATMALSIFVFSQLAEMPQFPILELPRYIGLLILTAGISLALVGLKMKTPTE